MSWFKKKGNYWYFVERENGYEIQRYIGNDQAVVKKLINKLDVTCPICNQGHVLIQHEDKTLYCSWCNKILILLPKSKSSAVLDQEKEKQLLDQKKIRPAPDHQGSRKISTA